MKRKVLLILGLVLAIILVAASIQLFSRGMPFTDMNGELLTCMAPLFDLKDSQFIINSDQDYQALLKYKIPGSNCENFKLPVIDFSQNTLLGKYASGSGCSTKFMRQIYKDDTNKKVTYSIQVIEVGGCEPLAMSMNWALIPKIPSDYRVEFKVK